MRKALRVELLELAAAFPRKSGKAPRNAWIRLGASGWQGTVDLRQTIDSWVEELE
jgi:hypothetical protein